MAFINEIEAQRFARMLQKFFGIKGGAPVRQVASEISPAFPLFSGCENRYLEAWDRFVAAPSVGPVAANMSGIRFRNPPGSGVIIAIESYLISEGTNDRILCRLGTATTDLATVQGIAGNRIDSRGRPNPIAIVSFQATAPTVPALTGQSTTHAFFLLANTPWQLISDENQEISLAPGDALQVEQATVNEALAVSWIWRERGLEDAERT